MLTALEFYEGRPDLPDLGLIRLWLQGLPDRAIDLRTGDGLWSCHGLCRAAIKKWKLLEDNWQVKDGFFSGHYQHSWLKRAGLILDIYPVGSMGGPLLVSTSGPWGKFYEERQEPFPTSRQKVFDEEALAILGVES